MYGVELWLQRSVLIKRAAKQLTYEVGNSLLTLLHIAISEHVLDLLCCHHLHDAV